MSQADAMVFHFFFIVLNNIKVEINPSPCASFIKVGFASCVQYFVSDDEMIHETETTILMRGCCQLTKKNTRQ